MTSISRCTCFSVSSLRLSFIRVRREKFVKLQLLLPLSWDWRGKFFLHFKGIRALLHSSVHSGILLVRISYTFGVSFLFHATNFLPFVREYIWPRGTHLKWFPIGYRVKLYYYYHRHPFDLCACWVQPSEDNMEVIFQTTQPFWLQSVCMSYDMKIIEIKYKMQPPKQ